MHGQGFYAGDSLYYVPSFPGGHRGRETRFCNQRFDSGIDFGGFNNQYGGCNNHYGDDYSVNMDFNMSGMDSCYYGNYGSAGYMTGMDSMMIGGGYPMGGNAMYCQPRGGGFGKFLLGVAAGLGLGALLNNTEGGLGGIFGKIGDAFRNLFGGGATDKNNGTIDDTSGTVIDSNPPASRVMEQRNMLDTTKKLLNPADAKLAPITPKKAPSAEDIEAAKKEAAAADAEALAEEKAGDLSSKPKDKKTDDDNDH